MIFGTVVWAWNGYIELGLILCAWGIWLEIAIMNAKLQFKILSNKDAE
jgi:non-homologous end joining protein Ku